jgi:hypothetical protein
MFVLRSTYKRAIEQINHLDSELARADNRVVRAEAEKNKLRQALHAIVKQKTPSANATVSRMAAYATAALNGTFGNRKG